MTQHDYLKSLIREDSELLEKYDSFLAGAGAVTEILQEADEELDDDEFREELAAHFLNEIE